MMADNYKHKSVLLDEAVELLLQDPSGLYMDGTFGRGGHSHLILQGLDAQGELQAFDKDPQAIAVASAIRDQDQRLQIAQTSFANLRQVAEQRGWSDKVDGVLLDLGVSSPQLDDPERGFSFMHDGPLDMRMNPDEGMSASETIKIDKTHEINCDTDFTPI